MTDRTQPPGWASAPSGQGPRQRGVWTPYRASAAGPRAAPGQVPAEPPGPPVPPGYAHEEPPPWLAGQPASVPWPSGAPGAPDGPEPAGRDRDRDDQWAMFGYFGAIFTWLVAPTVVYILKRRSLFVRQHAAQSFNLAATATLFALSIAIIGGLLALDSTRAALVLMVPLLVALWIAVMVYLVRAASAASRGEFYEIPAWICVPMVK